MELTLVLTHACNLGCSYCYAGAKDARAMPEEVARQALAWALARCGGGRQAAVGGYDGRSPSAHGSGAPATESSCDKGRGAGPQGRGGEAPELLLGYFGGEPLLRWDLLTRYHALAEELAAAAGVKLKHTVTTNATLLTAERMDWLASRGITVGVSIDGTRAAHERMRPRAGGGSSYDAVLAGLRTAVARVPMTQTISVVHPATVGELAAGVDALLAEGVRVLSLSLDPSAAWDLGSLETAREQLELIGDRWLVEYRAGRDLWIEPLDGKIVAHIKGGLQDCDRCEAGVAELAVAPSGRWYPCERMVGADGAAEARWCLGRGADGGPDAARVRALTGQHAAEPAACQACPLRARCQHHCACSNAMASGDLAQPGGAQCAWEQSAIATADRMAAAVWSEGNALFLQRRYRLVA